MRSMKEEILSNPNLEKVELSFERHILPYNSVRGSPDDNVNDDEDRDLQQRGPPSQVPYGIRMVQADKIPPIPSANAIKVCVVDTGYDLGHSDLPDTFTGVGGYNPYPEGKWSVDGNGHGTHTAGTLGAIGQNYIGVTSILNDPYRFTFYIGKGLQDNGIGYSAAVMSAVQACKDNGAKVISMSLGGEGYSETENSFYSRLYEDDGLLFVAAAGNSGNTDMVYPASYPSVMAVAAVDSNEDRASFSQTNNQVEIAAPGVGVLSTVSGNNYAKYSGTSMATPHVAGVAALLWSHFPQCSNKQIRNAILKTAKDKGDTGWDNEYGYGLIQANDAYEHLWYSGCGEESSVIGEDLGGFKQIRSNVCETTTCASCQVCRNDRGVAVCGFDLSNDNIREVVITLNPDDYPQETTWTVEAPGISESGKATGSVKVCDGERAIFTIYDSFGDGISGQHGSGSYSVTIDDVVVASGAEFEFMESTVIVFPDAKTTEQQAPAIPSVGVGGWKEEALVNKAAATGTTREPQEEIYEVVSPQIDDTRNSDPARKGMGVPEAATISAPATEVKISEGTPMDLLYGLAGARDSETVTAEPTTSSTVAPTSSPQGICQGSTLEVNILFDKFPSENSWEIRDSRDNVVESGGPFSQKNAEILTSTEYCLSSGSYTFEITDSGNDGICCGYGNGQFDIRLEGEIILSGTSFGPSAKKEFFIKDTIDVSNCIGIDIDITTDQFPGETTWSLKDSSSAGGSAVLSGGPYKEQDKTYATSHCINPGTYTFVIFDAGGDGMCCGPYGDGSYSVKVGDNIVASGGKFQATESKTFQVS